MTTASLWTSPCGSISRPNRIAVTCADAIFDAAAASPMISASRMHTNLYDMWRSIVALTAIWPAIGRAQPDAHRLATGEFVYQSLENGRDVGLGRVTIRPLSGGERYDFRAEITGSAVQRWEAVATRTFQPLSATITFGPDTAGSAPSFTLEYHAGRVTGFVIPHSGPSRGVRREIDTIVPAGIIDQRIDWASVMASDLAVGRRFPLAVYDPQLGVSPVAVTVDSAERVHVAAGTFDVFRVTYRIAKATGTEQYVVLVTRSLPRVMVREEFPDGVVSDLVKRR